MASSRCGARKVEPLDFHSEAKQTLAWFTRQHTRGTRPGSPHKRTSCRQRAQVAQPHSERPQVGDTRAGHQKENLGQRQDPSRRSHAPPPPETCFERCETLTTPLSSKGLLTRGISFKLDPSVDPSPHHQPPNRVLNERIRSFFLLHQLA